LLKRASLSETDLDVNYLMHCIRESDGPVA